jgi:hypothetical protein
MVGVQILFQVVSFLDICSITTGDANYLILIEREEEVSDSLQDFRLEKTSWYIWRSQGVSKDLAKFSEQIIYLPMPMALDLTVSDSELFGLVESNADFPAFLLRWSIKEAKSLRIAQEADHIYPLRLVDQQLDRVVITPLEDWSSPFLRTREWLFNPCIHLQRGDSEVHAAINTANADAILMKCTSKITHVEEKTYIQRALEPAYYDLSNRSFVAFRRVGERWSVFYRTPRYSDVRGPLALPLVLVELDDQGNIKQERELSELKEFGEVFMFDFTGDGEKRLALAAVRGLKERPMLALYFSEDMGITWQRKGTFRLPSIPVRMSMTLNGEEALVGLAFLEFGETSYYQIAAVRCKP